MLRSLVGSEMCIRDRLPVHFRITYKLCIQMYNIRAGKCPCYLRDIMQPTIARVTRSGLRSHSDTTSYVTPRPSTKFTERAFSFSGPAARNSLAADLRTVSHHRFKNKTIFLNWIFTFNRCLYEFLSYLHIVLFTRLFSLYIQAIGLLQCTCVL